MTELARPDVQQHGRTEAQQFPLGTHGEHVVEHGCLPVPPLDRELEADGGGATECGVKESLVAEVRAATVAGLPPPS